MHLPGNLQPTGIYKFTLITAYLDLYACTYWSCVTTTAHIHLSSLMDTARVCMCVSTFWFSTTASPLYFSFSWKPNRKLFKALISQHLKVISVISCLCACYCVSIALLCKYIYSKKFLQLLTQSVVHQITITLQEEFIICPYTMFDYNAISDFYFHLKTFLTN